jgi:hypothetical protein
MNSKQKNVLLWNPISNHGHLNMYLELYADCLIQLGYNVLYYADLDAEFEAYLKVELPKLRSVEAIVSTKNLKRWSFSWVYFVGKNLTIRTLKDFFFSLGKTFLKTNTSSGFVEFGVLTRKLKILKDSDVVPDLVVCMYLDMTRLTKHSRQRLYNSRIPWVGLLFHPESLTNLTGFSKNSWFQESTNVGGIFFTDKYIDEYQSCARRNQVFQVFPDASKFRSLLGQSLPQEFSGLAKGRRIIGLVGALDGNKKLIGEFLKLSTHPLMNDFYFVLAGEVYESSLDSDVLEEVRRLSGSIQENLFVYDKYIESELHYDSLVNHVDILFACYKDFDSSANILAKSAIFQKPVLVTSGTWIGNLVEKYKLGEAVLPFSMDNLINGILNISNQLDTDPQNFGFKDYEFYVSQENLRNHLRDYLEELFTKEAIL